MKTKVISYSLSGNNRSLAQNIAENLKAEHIEIKDLKKRSMNTIILDMLFNRSPKIIMPDIECMENELIIFAAPVWMGKIASPMRKCFKKLKNKLNNYAFISISGGALGPNPKLESELLSRTGKKPLAVIDMHIVDLLPTDPKPTREDTSKYKLNKNDISTLSKKAVEKLETVYI